MRMSVISQELNLQFSCNINPFSTECSSLAGVLVMEGDQDGEGGTGWGLYRWAEAVFQMVTETEICAHSPQFF